VTEFTIFLDVFDSGSGSLSVTRTFKLKTNAIQIAAAATVNVVDTTEDPFHAGSFINVIKGSHDPSPAVPEVSIGGAFSVTGSAYAVGCDRILSQYNLVRFDASPALPAPTPADATGGSGLVPTPVAYDGTPAHPWSSGCLPVSTPNIILSGNLVATWSTDTSSFLGFDYTVPKVKPLSFFGSAPLNGPVRDPARGARRAVGGGASALAGVDQIVV
jgi:hypothetical protein